MWCRGLPDSEPMWYKPLSLADCRKLLKIRMEIQLHGHSHRPLGSLDDDDLHEEISNVKTTIEKLGAGDAIALAYRLLRIPIHEHDRGLLFQAKAAGYCGILPIVKAAAYRMGVWTSRAPTMSEP